MKIGSRGHIWLVFAVLLVILTVFNEGATSLSPTYAPVINVVGKVYCYRCFNEAHPEESHGKEHLQGAMVKVTCQAGDQALVRFGYTESNGKYSVGITGLPTGSADGADSCKVELHAAPGGSDCNVPMELSFSGVSVHSSSSMEVVLQANQAMAFASKKTFAGCSKPHTPPPPSPRRNPYHQAPPASHSYSSPPPLPPTSHKYLPPPYYYYYSSPPPQSQHPSPPSNQNSPPPHGHGSSPPPYQYSPPLPPKHLRPDAPRVMSPTAYSVPSQPLLHHYNSPPPPHQEETPSAPPSLSSYQSPPPPPASLSRHQ